MKARSLRDRTISALSWSFVDSFGSQGIQFIMSVVLARLLAPESFGLISMLAVFTAVAMLLIEGGFSGALIQKRELESKDRSTVFWFNLASGAVVAILMYALAPYVAKFYGQPELTRVARVLCLVFIIHAFVAVQLAQLTRDLEFLPLTKANLSANIVSGSVAIYLAAFGFGVWSLVAQQIVSSLVRALLLWRFSAWRPTAEFSGESLKSLFGFGSRMAASGLLDSIFGNLYFVAIGRLFGAANVGVYSRANWLTQVPIQSLSQVVARVTFPVFSAMQEEPARLRRNMAHALRSLALLGFPMMVGMLVVAEPLVQVILTAKWLSAVPYIQMLCVVGLLHPLHVINLNLLMALGRSDLFLRLEVIKKALVLVGILSTYRHGIAWMIFGQIVLSAVAYFLNSYWTGRFIGYGSWAQLKDVAPYMLVSLLMGTVVFLTGQAVFFNATIGLVVQILSGVVFYIAVCVMARLKAIEGIRAVLCRRA